MIALYLNSTRFYSTARSTFLFQLPGQIFKTFSIERDARNDGYPGALSTFGFPAYPDNPIRGSAHLAFSADTVIDGTSAFWTGFSKFRGINDTLIFIVL